jgi:hypothetical protein
MRSVDRCTTSARHARRMLTRSGASLFRHSSSCDILRATPQSQRRIAIDASRISTLTMHDGAAHKRLIPSRRRRCSSGS